jgi:hypothetical protein
MDSPFSWDYLTTQPGPNEVFGVLALFFLAVFSIGFTITFVTYAGWADRRVSDPIHRRFMRTWSGWALSLFATGLFFFLIRVLQINPFTFGYRIWLYLCWLALLAFVVYLLRDYRKKAPIYRAQIEERNKLTNVVVNVAGKRGANKATTISVGARPVKRRKRR